MDSFTICADALIAKAAERNVSLKTAEDLIPSSILLRAWADFAAKPQMVAGGGWASGGSQVMTGTYGRRIVDHEKFRREVAEYAAAKRKRVAA
jgi:hypothetical protein